MESNLPKVLVVGINAWRIDASAHTLMNIFSCWDAEKLSLLYTRADLPYTNVCSKYFQINENAVLKSIYKPWVKTGKEVFNTEIVNDKNVDEEHKRYAKARKKHSYFMSLCREIVWSLGHWKTKELKKFINEFNPDVIFCPIYPTVFMGKIQRYIKKITNKPIVCYLADDNYSYDTCKGLLSYVHRYFLRKQVKYLATNCDKMFVIVEKEKIETDKLFGTDSAILTKGIDFSNISYEEKQPNKPLKFVYTGKLIIDRDKTLAKIADALNEINNSSNEIKATLEIYSPDVVSNEVMAKLNNGCSRHCGCVSHEKVEGILKEADVVIFAEALEGEFANSARLSFSTKITDYLSSGKCVLAVGKEDIAPIEYFVKNDSAIVSCNEKQLYDNLNYILNNPQVVVEYGKKAFDCAKRNHDKAVIDKMLIETITEVANK